MRSDARGIQLGARVAPDVVDAVRILAATRRQSQGQLITELIRREIEQLPPAMRAAVREVGAVSNA